MHSCHPSVPPHNDFFWLDADRPNDPEDTETAEFTIAELAKDLGVTQRALRFYEARGLVKPARRGRRRIFSRADRDRISLIIKGKKLGFTLNEINQMIGAQEGRASQQSLKLTAEKCLEQIAHFEAQMKDVMATLMELRRIHAFLCTQAMRAGDPSAPLKNPPPNG